MSMQSIAWRLMSESDYGDYIADTHSNINEAEGTLRERWEIYCNCMEGTGEYVKTFDEWVNS